jgi:hypothetical protein
MLWCLRLLASCSCGFDGINGDWVFIDPGICALERLRSFIALPFNRAGIQPLARMRII